MLIHGTYVYLKMHEIYFLGYIYLVVHRYTQITCQVFREHKINVVFSIIININMYIS